MRTPDRITALYPDQSLQRFVEKPKGTLPIEIRSCGGVPPVSAGASGGRLRRHSGASLTSGVVAFVAHPRMRHSLPSALVLDRGCDRRG